MARFWDSIPLASYIEHTLLGPKVRTADLLPFVEDGIRFGVRGLCVTSDRVAAVRGLLEDRGVLSRLLLVATLGFPWGAVHTGAKVREAEAAVADGASEVDMVWSLGRFLDGDYDAVLRDIQAVVDAVSGRAVKVILETDWLSPEQIADGARLAVDAGAAFVKTSTGVNTRGASVEAVRLMRASVPAHIGVKAAGGIGDRNTALAMVEAGANRLGMSRTRAVLGTVQP